MTENVSPNRANTVLLLATFIIAICGLIYELLAGAISSYLLGDSVFQFSLVIGLFLASMGVGSYLSRFVGERLAETFIIVQCIIAIVGGFSAYLLFFSFSHLDNYQPVLYLLCLLIGSLVGVEIPIVIRLLKEYRILRLNVSNVLTADYIGALAASLAFPLVLVPQLGLFRTSLLFGLLNCFVAALGLYIFFNHLQNRKFLLTTTAACIVTLIAGFFMVNSLTGFFQSRLYSGEIIFSKSSPYQQIVLTRDDDVISLYLNGHLQFNSLDEYRYHESLVHPAMMLSRRHDNILVLGGGDGLAIREILKYEDAGSITLVDLDPEVTHLFKNNSLLTSLNKNALSDERVRIINTDAWKFLETDQTVYNVIIIDLPDPSDIGISKLYTRAFYSMASRHLAADGIMVTQATSPIYAQQAFWSIHHTIDETPSHLGFAETLSTIPYHAYVPTFGEWGFVIAAHHVPDWQDLKPVVKTTFLDEQLLRGMRHFPPDMAEVNSEINTIEQHLLVPYYEKGWRKWFH